MRHIVIIERNSMVRRGLARLLAQHVDAVQVSEYDGPEAAAAASSEPPPDLLLVGVEQTIRRTIQALGPIRRRLPSTRVALMDGGLDRRDTLRCLAAGCVGALDRDAQTHEIVEAVQRLLEGRVHVAGLGTALPDDIRDPTEALAPVLQDMRPLTHAPRHLGRLTARQREVLDLLVAGLSNKEIGDRLGISPSTAKIHVATVLRTLNVRNRAEAVGFLHESGLIADIDSTGGAA